MHPAGLWSIVSVDRSPAAGIERPPGFDMPAIAMASQPSSRPVASWCLTLVNYRTPVARLYLELLRARNRFQRHRAGYQPLWPPTAPVGAKRVATEAQKRDNRADQHRNPGMFG
jgi:hypothetical protein